MTACRLRGCDLPGAGMTGRFCTVHLDRLAAEPNWVPVSTGGHLRCSLCGTIIVPARRADGPGGAYALEVHPDGRCQLLDDGTFIVLNAAALDRHLDDLAHLGQTPRLYRNHGPVCTQRGRA